MRRRKALLLALLTAGCASARPTANTPAIAQRQCAANLAMYRNQVAKALADNTIDQPVYDDQARRIASVEKICATGDSEAANVMLLDAAIALNFGADDAYARSLNKTNR